MSIALPNSVEGQNHFLNTVLFIAVRMIRGKSLAIKTPILNNRGAHPHKRKYEDKALKIKGNLWMMAVKTGCEENEKSGRVCYFEIPAFQWVSFLKTAGLAGWGFRG